MAHHGAMTLIIDADWTSPLTAEIFRIAAKSMPHSTITLEQLTFDAGKYDEPSAEYLDWMSR